MSIIVPSGSEKSTLLRCLVQLEKIDKGIIEVEEIPISSCDKSGEIIEDASPDKMFTNPDHPMIKLFLEKML